jgi:hypothetical protein
MFRILIREDPHYYAGSESASKAEGWFHPHTRVPYCFYTNVKIQTVVSELRLKTEVSKNNPASRLALYISPNRTHLGAGDEGFIQPIQRLGRDCSPRQTKTTQPTASPFPTR